MTTLLNQACEDGDIKKVESLIQSGPVLIDDETLKYSCRGRNVEIVKLMILKGANDFNSGLYSSCTHDDIEIAELMINGYNDCNDCNGATNFEESYKYACARGSIKIVKILAEKLDINAIGSGFSEACKYDCLKIVTYILEKYKEIIDTSKYWDQWFYDACGRNKMTVIRYVIDMCKKYNINCVYNYYLSVACKKNKIKAVKFLMNSIKYTPIMLNNIIHDMYTKFEFHKLTGSNRAYVSRLFVKNGADYFGYFHCTDDFRLYCLYYKNRRTEDEYDSYAEDRYIKLLRKCPPYALLVMSCVVRSKPSKPSDQITSPNTQKCHIHRLPTELFRLLWEY